MMENSTTWKELISRALGKPEKSSSRNIPFWEGEKLVSQENSLNVNEKKHLKQTTPNASCMDYLPTVYIT